MLNLKRDGRIFNLNNTLPQPLHNFYVEIICIEINIYCSIYELMLLFIQINIFFIRANATVKISEKWVEIALIE